MLSMADPRPRGDVGLEGRDGGDAFEYAVEGARGCAGQPGTEVGGLHGSRSSASGHGHPGGSEVVRQVCGVEVHRVVAGERMSAHQPDDATPVDELAECVVDRAVMERLREQFLQGAGRTAGARPGIDLRVCRAVVAVRQPVVQLIGGVEAGSPRVERHVRHRREDQRPARAQAVGRCLRHRAAEEQGSSWVEPEQHVLAAGEVEPLDLPVTHRPARGFGALRRTVELLERLDLDHG